MDRYLRDRNFHEFLGMLTAKRRLRQEVVGDWAVLSWLKLVLFI